MGFAENMRIWSGINCGLASLVGYTQMKSNGVDTNTAIGATAGNVLNGLARNEVAYECKNGQSHRQYDKYVCRIWKPRFKCNRNGWTFVCLFTLGIFNAPCTMFYTPIATPFFGGLGYGDLATTVQQ